jgi:hypothetical protein
MISKKSLRLKTKTVASVSLLVVFLTVSGVVFLVTKNFPMTIVYLGMEDTTIHFLVRNKELSDRAVDFKTFVLATSGFGGFDSDRFESDLGEQTTFNVAGGSMGRINVNAMPDTEQYLCASLRSIGFFSTYGTLKQGRLIPNTIAKSTRSESIIKDLQCWFRVLEINSDGSFNHTYNLPVECKSVPLVSSCVESALPDGQRIN